MVIPLIFYGVWYFPGNDDWFPFIFFVFMFGIIGAMLGMMLAFMIARLKTSEMEIASYNGKQFQFKNEEYKSLFGRLNPNLIQEDYHIY